jgi:tetratricopeptide (TPR) repeat protein
MNSVSKVALGVALALGSTIALTSGPAAAQTQTAELNKSERAALLAFQTALEAKNYTAATSAMNAAQSAARTGYSRYLASALQLRLGIETNNIGLQTTAIESMIGSGVAAPAELSQLYRNQAALFQNAGKLDKAEAVMTRYLETAPNDLDGMLGLAQIKHDRKKPQEALTLIDRAIDLRKASGQPVPESWYRRGTALALQNKMMPQALRLSRALVAAYPTPVNWRDAVLVHRDAVGADGEASLDAWRLMRTTNALAGERDYLQLAQVLSSSGLPSESKAVLDEGVSAKMVDAGKATYKELLASTGKRAATDRAGLNARQTKAMAAATGTEALKVGDAFLAQGDFAKAATLYQAALQKGSVDASLVNTRLGIALARAGQRTEADAAFRAVTGPRAEIANLWLVWLAQRA